jgi:rhodanese-related sulfurtransferase
MIESEKSLVIIDSNYAEQYKKEHIKGAIHLTPDAVTKESMAKVAPAMDTPLAFYCYNTSCPASKKAATKAAELGYSKVYKLPLGIEGWKKEGYSVDTM